MIQLVQENKSLWRIKNDYIKNADGDEGLLEFWRKMEKDKEAHVEELRTLVKKNLD